MKNPETPNQMTAALKDILREPDLTVPSDIRSLKLCMSAWNALEDTYLAVANRLARELGEKCGLSPNEFNTLVELGAQGEAGLHMFELVPVAKLSQPAVSRLIDRLERRDLVTRETGESDRRNVLIRITPAGEDLVYRGAPIHAACIYQTMLAPLDKTERRAHWRILMKLHGGETGPAPWELPESGGSE